LDRYLQKKKKTFIILTDKPEKWLHERDENNCMDNIKINFCFGVSVTEPFICFNYGYGKCYRGWEARVLVPILPSVFLLCHTFMHSLPFHPEDRKC
jgi:hypothetical protein